MRVTMRDSMDPILESTDGTRTLCERRIRVGQIHCLFAVIHCSYANDEIPRLVQAIDVEAVERNYPSFLQARLGKFTVKFAVPSRFPTLRAYTVGRRIGHWMINRNGNGLRR